MKTSEFPSFNRASRQIVGLSLSPEVAAELKMEAARRGLSIRDLFLEMWTEYKKKPEKQPT